MAFDAERHHRRSVRLRDYDYAAPGAYFVTICTRGRMGTLGESTGERIVLSEAGLIAESTWESLPSRFPSVQLDTFIVMPDHLRADTCWFTRDTGPPHPHVQGRRRAGGPGLRHAGLRMATRLLRASGAR